MNRTLFICFFVAISFQLTSCQMFSNKPDYITSKDNGKIFNLEKGEGFSIKLDTSPENGYMWDILPYNEDIISFINSKFEKNEELKGERIIRFKATSTGEADLKLIYYKIWEKTKSPVKEINIRIVVK